MPARNALTGTVIDTGIMYPDVVDNVHQLIVEHLDSLGCRGDDQLENSIAKYDEMKVNHTPYISIVWESMNVSSNKINNCVQAVNNVTIYQYLCSLSYGNDTQQFLTPMYRLMELFLVHWDLYGYTRGTDKQVEIVNSTLVGRRLDSDVYLTHQLDLAINRRLCRDAHE